MAGVYARIFDPFEYHGPIWLALSHSIWITIFLMAIVQTAVWNQGFLERSALWIPTGLLIVLVFYAHSVDRRGRGLGPNWPKIVAVTTFYAFLSLIFYLWPRSRDS